MKRASMVLRAALIPPAAAAFVAAAQPLTIDNSSTGFTSTGTWTSTTQGSATFLGADHLVSTGLPTNSIIDNAAAQFSTSAGWSSSVKVSGYVGADYVSSKPPATGMFPTPVVIDNRSSGKALNTIHGSSAWPASTTLSGRYGKDYLVLQPGAPYPKAIRYSFNLQGPGNLGGTTNMLISAWWPQSSANADNTRIRLKDVYDKPLAEFVVNQRINGGKWVPIGIAPMSFSGPTYYIEFSGEGANGQVIADAIKIESVDAASAIFAKWKLPNLSGTYDVYARWPASSQHETFPSWAVVGGDGSDRPPSATQKSYGGVWRKMGRVDLGGVQENYVLLQHFDPGASLIAADAIAYVPSSRFPSAKWSANLSGPVNVTVSWSADATRAPDAKYTVWTQTSQPDGCYYKTTNVLVDQRSALDARGRSLGTFASDAACPLIEVTLEPGGQYGSLSADSVTFSR